MQLEEILEKDEVLLTHVKSYDEKEDDKQLCLNFRNLGDVYVPHLHTYSSIPLTKELIKELKLLINSEFINEDKNPFYEFKNSVEIKDHYFNILQIKAPRSFSREFQKLKYNSRKKQFEFTKQKGRKKIFNSGHFDELARWNIGYHDKEKTENDLNYEHCLQPGTIYKTDEKLIETLKRKKELENIHSKIKKEIGNFKNNYCNYKIKGDIISKLRHCFIDFEDIDLARKNYKSWNCKKYWTGIEKTNVVNLTKELVKKEIELKDFVKEYADLKYHTDKSNCLDNKYKLFLDKRSNFIKKRQLSFEEWMNLKYLMIDIETPKFLEGNNEITQISACVVEDGLVKKLKLFNKEKVNFKEINNHRIHSGYRTQESMVEEVSNWISEENVDVIMAYNNYFDFVKLRDAGWKLNNQGDKPKMDVTLNFFQRFYLGDGFCIDLMSLGKTMLRGFPNSKLEMFSRFLFEDKGYHKKITYKEMFELQKLSEGLVLNLDKSTISKLEIFSEKTFPELIKDSKLIKELSSKLILEYVSEDTTTMYDIFFNNELIKNSLKHLKFASELFDLDYTRVISSPKSLNVVYDRGYFKHVGISRDEIYMRGLPKFKKEIDKNKKAFDDYVNNLFDFSESIGTFNNVERRFIPVQNLLKEYNLHTSKKVNLFLDYVNGVFDNRKSSNNERIFLSRYVEGLLSYLQEDFGNYLRKKEKYEGVVKSIDECFSPLFKIQQDEFPKLSEEILDIISEINLKEYSFNENFKSEEYTNKLKSMQIKDFVKLLKKSSFFYEFITDHSEKELINKSLDCGLGVLDLYEIFHSYFDLKKQQNKFSGNYRLDVKTLKNCIDSGIERQIKKLTINKKILHVEFPYIVTGDNDPNRITNEFDENYDALFPKSVEEFQIKLPIQSKLSKVYISKGKVYTKEHGFYKGISVKKEPDYKTNPFISEIQETALNKFLDEDYVGGIEKVLNGMKIIESKIDSSNKASSDKIEFLNFNKQRKIFMGFENGDRYLFTEPKVYEFNLCDEIGNYYIEKCGKNKNKIYIKKDVSSKKEYFEIAMRNKIQKVYVHNIEDYNPDYKAVFEYSKNKFKDFVDSALKKVAEMKKYSLYHELDKILGSRNKTSKNLECSDVQQLEFDFN